MEGAFIRGQFDVTDLLKEGTNVLAVEIIKNEHIGAVKEKNKQSTDFNGGILGADNPTFHATIGWDWIPTVRGRNIGIWNDVKLTSTGKVTLQDPFVQTALALPDTTQATLTPEIIVKNHADEEVEGILSARDTGSQRRENGTFRSRAIPAAPAEEPAPVVAQRLW